MSETIDYKIHSRTIMRDAKQVSDAEAQRLAEANGYKKSEYLIIRFTGMSIVCDEQTLRIKGFRKL